MDYALYWCVSHCFPDHTPVDARDSVVTFNIRANDMVNKVDDGDDAVPKRSYEASTSRVNPSGHDNGQSNLLVGIRYSSHVVAAFVGIQNCAL